MDHLDYLAIKGNGENKALWNQFLHVSPEVIQTKEQVRTFCSGTAMLATMSSSRSLNQ